MTLTQARYEGANMATRSVRPITVIGDLAFIPLTQHRAAMIDAEDVSVVKSYNWRVLRTAWSSYAVHTRYPESLGNLFVHRLVVGLPQGGELEVDHINGNGLDNRRCNLRICTSAENKANRRPNRNGTSKYKGVCWSQPLRKWCAYIKVDGKSKYLGLFDVEEDAAAAYRSAARECFGEFAWRGDLTRDEAWGNAAQS